MIAGKCGSFLSLSLHKTLFALVQAATGVAVSMHIYMFKAHAALGEGLQAVALMKNMRGVGLPVPAPACSLLVLAFCKADALQVQHTAYAFTAHLPCRILVRVHAGYTAAFSVHNSCRSQFCFHIGRHCRHCHTLTRRCLLLGLPYG